MLITTNTRAGDNSEGLHLGDRDTCEHCPSGGCIQDVLLCNVVTSRHEAARHHHTADIWTHACHARNPDKGRV